MNAPAKRPALEVLASGRLIARNAAPYFRSMLLSFVCRPAPGLGTVACTKRGIFLYDPEVISGWSVEQMGGAWLHETMHRVLKHHDRGSGRDLDRLNVAQDLAINPGVIDMGLQLPDGGVFPEKYGFERGLTSDEYYDLLGKLPQDEGKGGGKGKSGAKGPKQKGSKGAPGDEEGDGESGDDGEQDGQGNGGKGSGKPGQGPAKPGVGAGWCGSCAAHEVDGEPGDDDAEGRSDAELDRLNRQVAEAIRGADAKTRGSIPAGWRKWADEKLTPPQIPWQAKLASATRRAASWAAGAVQHRYDLPGRRQAGIGYGKGKPILPRLRRPVPRVSIVIDTSGSMGPKETLAACSEVQGVLRAVGADVTFCACDAAVHTLAPLRDIGQLQAMMKGGGGTDFVPAFAALDAAKPRPEVVIFMTDGYGPAPAVAPVGMHVIWVLVGHPARVPYVEGEYTAEVTYGDKIEIPLDKGDE